MYQRIKTFLEMGMSLSSNTGQNGHESMPPKYGQIYDHKGAILQMALT